MSIFDCKTPGCTGRVAFVAEAGAQGEERLDQLTGHRIPRAEDAPVECPVCHVFWRERQLHGLPGAKPS